MKSIYQLIPDIQELLKTRGWFDAVSQSFSSGVSARLREQYREGERRPTLRLSQLGPRCPCALWYSIHHPELAEQLPPWAEFKFSFGHIIEGMAIALTRAAGHEVVGEQDAVSVDGIVGHRDCIIDGCLVDVKSASSRAFDKFKSGKIKEDDTFGYLDQLDGYLLGSAEDPLLTVKDRGYLLAIDKQLGHMCLYEHPLKDNGRPIRRRIAEYKEVLQHASPPRCTCGTVPDGQSGNIRLDIKASYNNYKYCCNPGIRTFIYSKGPVYLTHVARTPDVMEVDRYGHPV